MGSVITLPNGISIESDAGYDDDLYISEEAYGVLDTYSVESIFEAANIIALESEKQEIEKRRSKWDFTKDMIKGNAVASGVGLGALGAGVGFGANRLKGALLKNKAFKRALDSKTRKMIKKGRVPTGKLAALGLLTGAGIGALHGAQTGFVGGLANDKYHRDHGKNLSRSEAGAIGGGAIGALGGVPFGPAGMATGGIAGAVKNGIIGSYYDHKYQKKGK